MMALTIGEPAPWLVANSPTNPQYQLSAAAGRFLLLAFLPADRDARTRALDAVNAHSALFDDIRLAAFLVATDSETIAEAKDHIPGRRWFLDGDLAACRAFQVLDADGAVVPQWMVLDPTLRILATAPLHQVDHVFRFVRALPHSPSDHAMVPLSAPVLIVPRVFERDVCRQLIELYQVKGGLVSGVMREENGRTIPVVDDFKRRRDANIDDETLRQQLLIRIRRRLLPEISKAFQFAATRLERHIVACYSADEGGYFRPHRDNTTKATAHRRFAVSINLNTEEFEGGDLRFPEFGDRTYRPPTGGAVVFSCSLLHEATPVTKGLRYAYLPFLYDEAGAKIREANEQFLDPPAADPSQANVPA
jgi:predicted 2-oxoglutarate/Fe(II)-dependent dioxygenase YbiX/peroxiredoxin